MDKRAVKKNMVCALAAALATAALWRQRALTPSDVLLVLLYAGLFTLLRRGFDRARGRVGLVSALLGALFALFSTLSGLGSGDGMGFLLWLGIVFAGHFCIYTAALALIYTALETVSLSDDRKTAPGKGRETLVFFGSWGLLWLWFLLWLLFHYPGGVSVDSNLQLLQVLGLEPLSNHHPIVHTMLIKLFFKLGLSLSGGNENFGVALYSAFQSLMLALSFAYLIVTLYKERVKTWVILAVLGVYILLPYHGSYSVTMWKDVWFAGFMLVLCVSLWRLMLSSRRGESFRGGDLAVFFMAAVLMCLFRSNGLYAFVALLPFVTLLLFKSNRWTALLPLLALGLALLVKGPIYSALGIVPVDLVEALSVPGQHVARTIRDGAEISEEQYELLSKAVDPQALAAAYNPGSADAVKEVMRRQGDPEFIAEHKGEMLRLWLELGVQNPGSYLRAQIEQTQGYWDPAVQYWVLAPDFLVSYKMNIYADSRLPESLTSAANALLERIPGIPLLSLIFSIGAGVWVFLGLIGLCLVKKRYIELLIYFPVLAVWGTLIISTPIYAEFRYIYSLFTCLPLLGILPFFNEAENKGDLPM